MFQFDKHFTLEEANTLIPGLQQLFRKVHELIEPTACEIATYQKHASAKPGHAGDHAPPSGNGNGNGSHNGKSNGKGAQIQPLTPQQRIDAANELLRHVVNLGIVIQDWRRGLIDFPAVRDGHEVFLCYELSDGTSIQYFHDLDAGYAGRQPL